MGIHAVMDESLELMVFTDLDGTLLDHQTYQSTGTEDALGALLRLNAALVLASSKTPSEMASLRRDLGFAKWPAIVENGAGLLAPFADPTQDQSNYIKLREHLNSLPQYLRSCFDGFGDMSVEKVAEITGLAPDQAERAKARAFSEPGLWTGTDKDREAFLSQLNAFGIVGQQGGRFFTLSYGQTKADRVRELCATYRPKHTIALGDAPNDIAMLESVDYGVIVANPASPPLPQLNGEAQGNIMRTKEPGPLGWNAAILTLLEKLKLKGA